MRAHYPVQLALFAVTALVAACDTSPTGLEDGRITVLVVKPSAATLLTGRQLQLNVTSQGALDRPLTATDVLWSSTDDAVATVSPEGVVTARRDGAAQITAWFEGHRAFATVKVLDHGNPGPCGFPELAAEPSQQKTSNCTAEPPAAGGEQ
jgi:hypothetical protein